MAIVAAVATSHSNVVIAGRGTILRDAVATSQGSAVAVGSMETVGAVKFSAILLGMDSPVLINAKDRDMAYAILSVKYSGNLILQLTSDNWRMNSDHLIGVVKL